MGITEIFNNYLDLIFKWLVDWDPLGGLIVITFIMTLVVTLIYKYATDQEVMKSIKEETKEIQKKIKSLKDHPEQVMKHNKELMEKQLAMFKQSLKPMIITLLPVLLLFTWLRTTYTPIVEEQGKLFIGLGWLGTYILFSIVFNLILRKLLKVH